MATGDGRSEMHQGRQQERTTDQPRWKYQQRAMSMPTSVSCCQRAPISSLSGSERLSNAIKLVKMLFYRRSVIRMLCLSFTSRSFLCNIFSKRYIQAARYDKPLFQQTPICCKHVVFETLRALSLQFISISWNQPCSLLASAVPPRHSSSLLSFRLSVGLASASRTLRERPQ
jgi:hypothetical protein